MDDSQQNQNPQTDQQRADQQQADNKPKTVTMESIQWHTHAGEAHPVGDTYELPEDLVDSVQAQGKAIRTDRVEHAQRQADAAKQQQQGSHPVEPMTTHDMPGTTPEVK
jgi:hypothetical protein